MIERLLRTWFLAASVLLVAHTTNADQPTDDGGLELMRRDAELADVTFVDAREGWAVGDRGVIWHTVDGGRQWRLQKSGVRCRLSAVTFIDAQHGWAVGGWTEPYTHVSQGIVLLTRDGGRRWQPAHRTLVPALVGVRFFDAKGGVAFGKPSALFPSGVFTSDDGGRSWTTVPATQGRAWLAGDFIDTNTGALAGRSGNLAVLRRRTLEPARTGGVGLRALRRMRLVAPTGGWLVGDGGLVLRTNDLGTTWQTTAGQLPQDAASHFDLSALAVQGEHCWVAGSPGTRIFHTADGGKSWTSHSTGSHVPIRSLHFAEDEMSGWAVGALGTILASRDGGKTWHSQQNGGTRAALLGLLSEPDRLPLELFAQLSAADGYLGVVSFLARRDLDVQAGISEDLPDRAHEAMVEVGASGAQTAWQFPLRQAGLRLSADRLLETLNRAHDGRALEQLEAHVVRQIRTWRPEVIVTHHASPRGDNPLGHLINQVVLQAVNKAADPTSYVDLATSAGLEPWKTKKVYGTLGEGLQGDATINTARVEPRLGRSLAELAGTARAVLAPRHLPQPQQLGMRLLVDRIPQDRGKQDFFSGIALSPGGEARRMPRHDNHDSIDALHRMAQKRRNMQALLDRAEHNRLANPAWLGQIANLTSDLNPQQSAQILFQLATSYRRAGRWELSAGALESLIENHPKDPLAQSARAWLLKYYASGEVAWRIAETAGIQVQRAAATGSPGIDRDVIPAGDASPLAVRQSKQLQGAGGAFHDARFEKAARLGKEMERAQPVLFAEPHLRFPLACAHRKLGYDNQADRYVLGLRRNRPHDAWWNCAQGEFWLAERKGASPKAIWTVRRTNQRPHLDGKLDEPWWQSARSVALHSAVRDDHAWPAEARLAYDDAFLYLGLRAAKSSAAKYRTTEALRERDADLAAHDRIELLLDIDRDYATYYRLVIDHRGWASEACWGDSTWNPQWFVASQSDDELWTAEAAVPLSALTGTTPSAGHIWAAGIQRTVPGVGFQSWTEPAGIQVAPEGFGYLLFQ